MEITTLCTIVASMTVVPNRSQFFMYESVALSCAEAGSVKRNTTLHVSEECSVSWGKRNKSHCFISDLHTFDTGAYWCEVGGAGGVGGVGGVGGAGGVGGVGGCGRAVNITVTGGSVILESPVLPVQEGQPVTLRCTSQNSSSSDLVQFYKDGVLVGPTGHMTIRSVSKSHEGLYTCNILGVGESRASWLAVRASRPAESSRFPFACVPLPVVAVCLMLASAMLLRFWRNRKGKINSGVSYTDVSIMPQNVPPKKAGEMHNSSTFYSTLKP
ncbi:uncharacterized protein LOC117748111 [Cyclopterus lumpus]|uniref:uncharacterized protein LOC117748111 n=1 Tax=Cyclopterus lumpus TaxID=8103 RepID=UPI0014869504|nr:uncharacterized protein LOC117748111 [Cyclopterus lumpus]